MTEISLKIVMYGHLNNAALLLYLHQQKKSTLIRKFWTRNRPGDLMRDRYNLGAPNDDGNSSKTNATVNSNKAEVTNIPGNSHD